MEEERKKRVSDEREKLLNELNAKRNKIETCKAVISSLESALLKVKKQLKDAINEARSVEARLSRATKIKKLVDKPLSKYICDVLKRDDKENGTSFFENVKSEAIRLKEEEIRSTTNE